MSNVIGLSDEHEANLRKAAAYLITGKTAMRFDMSFYCASMDAEDHQDQITRPYQYACGTVGCALGHFPHIGIPPLSHETWMEYCYRVTGLIVEDGSPVELWKYWDWCFSQFWTHTDNTPQGAGKRILWLLDKGLPYDSERQRDGEVNLCYMEEF